MMLLLTFLLGLLLGTAVVDQRFQRMLRTELNSARANEQLLLTRLSSRSPAEFHAVTAAAERSEAPTVDNKRYLFDDTGLVEVVLDDEVDD